MRSMPNMSSSMELSPKRNCLHASSSENYVTDEEETAINVEKMIRKLEKGEGRRKKKGKKNWESAKCEKCKYLISNSSILAQQPRRVIFRYVTLIEEYLEYRNIKVCIAIYIYFYKFFDGLSLEIEYRKGCKIRFWCMGVFFDLILNIRSLFYSVNTSSIDKRYLFRDNNIYSKGTFAYNRVRRANEKPGLNYYKFLIEGIPHIDSRYIGKVKGKIYCQNNERFKSPVYGTIIVVFHLILRIKCYNYHQ